MRQSSEEVKIMYNRKQLHNIMNDRLKFASAIEEEKHEKKKTILIFK